MSGERVERWLAAILAADVAGYSRLKTARNGVIIAPVTAAFATRIGSNTLSLT